MRGRARAGGRRRAARTTWSRSGPSRSSGSWCAARGTSPGYGTRAVLLGTLSGPHSLSNSLPPAQIQIADVAFDPWKCDDAVYRFGSVAEDARLALWDFSVNALHRPRTVRRRAPPTRHPCRSPDTHLHKRHAHAPRQAAVVRNRSISSVSGARRAPAPAETVGERRGSFQMGRVVAAAPMHDVPVMEPVMVRPPIACGQVRSSAVKSL